MIRNDTPDKLEWSIQEQIRHSGTGALVGLNKTDRVTIYQHNSAIGSLDMGHACFIKS